MSKTLNLIALSSLLAAGAAMADGAITREALRQNQIATTSTVSRDAVIAELQQARQFGELARRDAESYSPAVAVTGSSKTRAQVLAELQAARASGEFAVLNSNNPSYAQLAALKNGAASALLAGQPATAR